MTARIPTVPKRLLEQRARFHQNICANVLGREAETRIFSNANADVSVSIDLAERMATKIGRNFTANPKTGYDAKAAVARYTLEFLQDAFNHIEAGDEGKPPFVAEAALKSIGRFQPYQHLARLVRKLHKDAQLRFALGGDYLVTPDVTVARNTALDLNSLYAAVSCKWTIKTENSQSGRGEPLSLIQTRWGNKPFVAVVTFEPMASRIASLAMGRGSIDCTYHGALYELIEAAKQSGYADTVDTLQTLVKNRRLRDISDLPFDLAAPAFVTEAYA